MVAFRPALGSRRAAKWLIAVLIAGTQSLALGDEPAQPPALKKWSVAFGYAGSIVHFDVPRNGEYRLNLDGLGALGRFDLHRRGNWNWGIQLGYSAKDAGTGSGGKFSLAQTDLHAYYAWEHVMENSLRVRFYPKVGVSRTDFEETVPSTGTFSDAAFGPSFGLGVEWGQLRWGLLFDVHWTFVDAELIPGQKESLGVSAGFIGLAFCF